MPTPLQLKLIHVAYRQAGLDEAGYRLVLRNVAGVGSARDLSQAGFEDCMAVFEDSGFRERGQADDYWRNKVALRGIFCGERMARKIEELAARQKYALSGLCQRASEGRVESVGKLRPREAWNLIEMLKAICAREDESPDGPADDASRPPPAMSQAKMASGPSAMADAV